MAKVPRCAVNGPRFAGLLIKPDTKAAALLAQIAFACGVHDVRVLAVHLVNFRHIIGDDILVFHRVKRGVCACHCGNFAGPKAACVHHMLGVDRTLVGDDIPCAVGTLVGFFDLGVQFNRGPTHARGLGIGVCGARRIEVSIKRIIKGTNDTI